MTEREVERQHTKNNKSTNTENTLAKTNNRKAHQQKERTQDRNKHRQKERKTDRQNN